MAVVFQFPYRTVAEISLGNLVKNLYVIRSLCKKEVIPIVKADAYGHGMVPVGRALVTRGGCLTMAVATLEEALEMRKRLPAGISIIVLSGFLPHQIEAYCRYRLIPMIHSLSHLKSLLGRNRLPEIHMKLDTGMNRLGIKREQLEEAVSTLEKLKIKLAGIATHFAESENSGSDFSDRQLVLFEKMHERLLDKGLIQTDAKIHVANSGGVLRRKVGISTAVRPGLSLFGISPNPQISHSDDLLPVMEWKTRILGFKEIKTNEGVGYGRTYKARRREKLALLPIGYADGYPRMLSNVGMVLVGGKRLPVRGNISMDLTSVGCKPHIQLKEGAMVTLIGKDGRDRISAWEVAYWAKTIPYEIFCGISTRVPRIYLD